MSYVATRQLTAAELAAVAGGYTLQAGLGAGEALATEMGATFEGYMHGDLTGATYEGDGNDGGAGGYALFSYTIGFDTYVVLGDDPNTGGDS